MAETSKIEWCDATFNPWVGCTKVSAVVSSVTDVLVQTHVVEALTVPSETRQPAFGSSASASASSERVGAPVVTS